jgi:CRP/FNR family transcriptional regulator, cyclic AMP receptor protein
MTMQIQAHAAMDGAEAMAGAPMAMTDRARGRQSARSSPKVLPGVCEACTVKRTGWFCSLTSGPLADLELASSDLSLPAQSPVFTEGADARFLYLICSGYVKLTAGTKEGRQMIVRVAGPGSLLGLYAAFTNGVHEVSAESLTRTQMRPVARERFVAFLRAHKEAQIRAVESICQEYRFALQDICRIALTETVAARLARLLMDLGRQIGESNGLGESCFPLLLTHEEMASMACTTRETVTRTLGQFRKDNWITIQNAMVTLHEPDRLNALL